MGSYSVEEFVGDGTLKGLIPKLVEEGWDDVPTLKMMNFQDMDHMKFTQHQKDALELRSYLHDRSLMEYADRLEVSRMSLAELLTLSTSTLATQFDMKRGHVARFIDRTITRHVPIPPSHSFPARERTLSSISRSTQDNEASRDLRRKQSAISSAKQSSKQEESTDKSRSDVIRKEGYVFKGIVASEPADPRLCGCVQPPPVVDSVAPYSTIENISVQKLTPEYKVGMHRLVEAKAPPMRASELWRDQPVVLLCIRRPGCIMCRAEAHQLYARKPVFDALGFQLIAVLHEQIEQEVRDFWPRYWGGVVVLDQGKDFFKALGGGDLLKDKFLTGFVFNPRAIANYKRAKSTGLDHNFRGEGEIKGGLFVVGHGKTGIAYQFIETNFGDWAPIGEVIDICSQFQNEWSAQEESVQRGSG
uniref:Peroxiredoxin-like 2A n=1 Tax=Ananas comosus var. bracteatus TaxID=296719 RepID=A0A6V7QX73_ANACO